MKKFELIYPTIQGVDRQRACLRTFMTSEAAMIFIRVVLIMIMSVSCFGCDLPWIDNLINDRLSGIKEQTFSLKSEVNGLRNDVVGLEKEIFELKQELDRSKAIANIGSYTFLMVGSTGYSTVKFDLGVITLSLENVSPYANGSKANIRFGNTLSCSIRGLNFHVEYGEVDDKNLPIVSTMRQKDITISDNLVPGKWTHSNLILDGLPPSKLGFMRISNVQHAGIALIK